MKPARYRIVRADGAVQCFGETGDGRSLGRIQHHVRHSPTGFEFGYGGSGPADLALSILWDYCGEEPHPAVAQMFKSFFIATATGGAFVIKAEDIDDFLADCERLA